MSAAYTHKLSVQVSDFEDIGLLIQLARLVCDFCSSDQRFACGFLQIPPRDGHPCRPANYSPCRASGRLSLPSECALPGARTKRPGPTCGPGRCIQTELDDAVRDIKSPSPFHRETRADVASEMGDEALRALLLRSDECVHASR